MQRTCQLFVLLVAVLGACRPAARTVPATQILLRVTASDEIRRAARKLRVHTAAQVAKDEAWRDRPAVTLNVSGENSHEWPLDIPIVPQTPGQLPELVQVVAEALDDRGVVLVQQRALTSFVRQAQLVLELQLTRCGERALGEICERDALCHGPLCQSCVSGGCRDTEVTQAADLPSVQESSADGGQATGTQVMASTGTAGDLADARDAGAPKQSPPSRAGSGGAAGSPSPKWFEKRCETDADCDGAKCLRQGWCAVVCNDDSRCGKAQDGTQHICGVDSIYREKPTCFVGCDIASGSGCEGFPKTTCQPLLDDDKRAVCDLLSGPGFPCSDDTHCESSLVCIDDTWCSPTSCTTDQECGKSPTGVQNSCLPARNSSICFAGCNTQDDCKAFTNARCQSVSGKQVCRVPRVGSVCTDSTQCGEDWQCTAGAWCTPEACSTDESCSPSWSPAAAPARCLVSADDKQLCFPGCVSSSDCSSFGKDVTCQTSPRGSVCSRRDVGTRCTANDQCGAGWKCVGGTWCSPEACSTDESCAPSQGSAAAPARCILNANNEQVCFPGCTSTSDCSLLHEDLTCQATPRGSACMIRLVGARCTSSDQCGAGWICVGGKWCSPESCADQSDCGTSTSGHPAVCAANSAGKIICWPGCLTDLDCAAYPDTYCDSAKGCAGRPMMMSESG